MVTGRLVRPVDAAGLYVPGGREGSTPLVSSVLMTAVPAGIAGVGRLVMVTPPNRQGRVHPALLVAARILGISEVYKLVPPGPLRPWPLARRASRRWT